MKKFLFIGAVLVLGAISVVTTSNHNQPSEVKSFVTEATPTQAQIIPTEKSVPTTELLPTTTPAPTLKPSYTVPIKPATINNAFGCNCAKTCTEISSCAEAQYQLNSCGCSRRDADGDGIACDGAPLHCQN